MFVLLALVFGLGFVVFGVGSVQGTGIGDILREGGGASGGNVSLSDAREQVADNPKSAEALRNLATALEEEGQTDEAINALNRYLVVAPTDQDAMRELAGLHLAQGNTFAQQAQAEQLRASYLSFGDTFRPALDPGSDRSLESDPIEQALSTQANEAINAAYTQAQQAFQQAVATYEKLVTVAPNDPNVRLELAQAAQQSGDYTKAIGAYQQFLKLAPDDPSAAIVKQQIAQLKAAQSPGSSG
jgi:tetratricopeptide (TPR) repeat protein